MVLPNVLGEDRINYILAIIGTIFAIGGSVCMIGTGLTPSDIVHDPHVFFANNIFHCFFSFVSKLNKKCESERQKMRHYTGQEAKT